MSHSTSLAIATVDGVSRVTRHDHVAVEEPLEIRLGYRAAQGRVARSVSITMRTPGDDLDLAVGFLYGEGIVNRQSDVLSVEHCGPPAADTGLRNVVRIELADTAVFDIARLERHFYTTSSCGVCGKTSLDAVAIAQTPGLAEVPGQYAAAMLADLPAALRSRQVAFGQTGGLHAAALFAADGSLLQVCEDVGRHNAVDKVVGKRLRAGRLPARDCGLLVSGRASFELMQKALRAGIPLLAAVGAPSSLAVAVAREYGMTLVGFLRGGRFNIYAGSARVV